MNHKKILKKYWGYTSFRQGQEEVINRVVQGEDVLAILPTGGGKSIIYQVAGLSKNGITLVVSPLIALIEDQVNTLTKLGIKSIALTGSIAFYDLERLLDNAQFSEIKFLFLSPERLQNKYVQRRLSQMNISLFVVDEAHCISEWGHDFRPSYLKIPVLKEYLDKIPTLALTATANKRVEEDIIKYLQLNKAYILRQSVKRENLAFKVKSVDDKYGKLLEILNKNETYIVYVRTRNQTSSLAYFLQQKGFLADYFHGGMSFEQKQNVLNNWLEDKIRIVVSTNAFGMGIDKSNVRKVIHFDLPNSIENYIQEAGRAGRDQNYAEAIILSSKADINYYQSVFIDNIPTLEDVLKVYKSIYNSFYIAEGEGENLEFDFDYKKFCKRFGLDTFKTFDILKVLQSEEILEIKSNSRYSAEVQIITNVERIKDYVYRKGKYYKLLDILIRTYSDIFYSFVNINKTKLIDILGYKIYELHNALNYLHIKEMIEYKPQGKDLSIRFLANKDRFLLKRKEKFFQKRLEIKKYQFQSLLDYVLDENTCRVRQLAKHFDENIEKDCGICDVCLSNQNNKTDEEIFLEIQKIISDNCLSKSNLEDLFLQDISQILDMLIEQNKIYFDVSKRKYCKK